MSEKIQAILIITAGVIGILYVMAYKFDHTEIISILGIFVTTVGAIYKDSIVKSLSGKK